MSLAFTRLRVRREVSGKGRWPVRQLSQTHSYRNFPFLKHTVYMQYALPDLGTFSLFILMLFCILLKLMTNVTHNSDTSNQLPIFVVVYNVETHVHFTLKS